MLQMIAEMEARGETCERTVIVGAGIVVIGKGARGIMVMRAPGAEVEQLERGQECRRAIEHENLRHGDAKNEPVDPNHAVHEEQRLPPEIAFEEGRVPLEEVRRVVLVKIGIALVPRQPVMRVMRLAQLGIGEPGIEEDQDGPDSRVDPFTPRNQRPVHRVMTDDEDADRKPALHHRQDNRERQARPCEFEHEHAVNMDRKPAARDQHRQRKPDCALRSAVRKGVSRRCHDWRYARNGHPGAYKATDTIGNLTPRARRTRADARQSEPDARFWHQCSTSST